MDRIKDYDKSKDDMTKRLDRLLMELEDSNGELLRLK